MGIFDAFRGFFGSPKHDPNNNWNSNQQYNNAPPMNDFKKPDWANEDEDDDEDLVYRSPPGNFTFSVFANPLEIHKYFEQQLNEMTKHLQDAFSQNEHFFNENIFIQEQPGAILQPPALLPPGGQAEEGNSLRGKCLKPHARKDWSRDTDLDSEFKSGQIDLFKPKQDQAPQIYSSTTQPQVFSSQIFTKVVRRPDGSMEEIRTKQIGDQKYTKITRTDAQGTTHVHEDIVNIDEDKIKEFQSGVGNMQMPKLDFKEWFRFRL